MLVTIQDSPSPCMYIRGPVGMPWLVSCLLYLQSCSVWWQQTICHQGSQIYSQPPLSTDICIPSLFVCLVEALDLLATMFNAYLPLLKPHCSFATITHSSCSMHWCACLSAVLSSTQCLGQLNTATVNHCQPDNACIALFSCKLSQLSSSISHVQVSSR